MATIGVTGDCEKCGGRGTVEYERRYDDSREECCDCGYYSETISPNSYERGEAIVMVPHAESVQPGVKEVSGELVTFSEKKLLEGFKKNNGSYIRRGILRKTEKQRGEHLVVNRWFSSPSYIPVEVVWDEDPTAWEIPTHGDGWKFHPADVRKKAKVIPISEKMNGKRK